jgi:hypothetical protein
MDANTRRKAIVAAFMGVLVFGTIIFAAEFGTGAENPPVSTRTVVVTTTVTATPNCLDTSALRRAREDARRAQHKVMANASNWLAP